MQSKAERNQRIIKALYAYRLSRPTNMDAGCSVNLTQKSYEDIINQIKKTLRGPEREARVYFSFLYPSENEKEASKCQVLKPETFMEKIKDPSIIASLASQTIRLCFELGNPPQELEII